MNKLKEIGNKFYQECEVVMLATDKKATNKPFTVGITLCNDCKLRIGNPVGKSESRQELYFLSNEEIKIDDWCLELGFNRIFQAEKESLSQDYIKNCKKIIATTDISLGLPQPSHSFIQAFIKAYNKDKTITKVLVEYETKLEWCYSHSGNKIQEPSNPFLKINSSNEVTIKKIKDSYTREEVIDLLEEYRIHLDDFPSVRTSEKYLTNWIEKYL